MDILIQTHKSTCEHVMAAFYGHGDKDKCQKKNKRKCKFKKNRFKIWTIFFKVGLKENRKHLWENWLES